LKLNKKYLLLLECENVKEALGSVFSLLLGTAFMMLGNGVLGTLLSVRTLQNGASEIETGLMMSAYFLGLILSALLASKVIAQVGHIRAFAVFASVYSAAVLAHGLNDATPFWLILRCIEGLCMGGFFMCTESWLNSKSDNLVRGKVLSAYMCVVYISQGGGQFLLNLDDPQAFSMLALVSILMSVALVPVALTKVSEPERPSPQFFSIKRLLTVSPLGVVGCVISGLLSGGIYGLGPVFISKLGYDVSATATLMASVIFGGLLLQWPLGGLSDRIDRRFVITFTMIMTSLLSVLLLLFAMSDFWVLVLVYSLFGGFAFAVYPLTVCHANDFVSEKDAVGMAGGLLLVYSVSAVIGPYLGGVLMELQGIDGFALYFLIASAIGAFFSLIRIFLGKTITEEDRGTYQVIPRTSAMVNELAPLEDEVEPAADATQ